MEYVSIYYIVYIILHSDFEGASILLLSMGSRTDHHKLTDPKLSYYVINLFAVIFFHTICGKDGIHSPRLNQRFHVLNRHIIEFLSIKQSGSVSMQWSLLLLNLTSNMLGHYIDSYGCIGYAKRSIQ